jgi:hypothetical protein
MVVHSRNRIILLTIILVITGILTYTLLINGEEPIVIYSEFTSGLETWVKDTDLPLDPNNPSHKVAWNITHIEDPINNTNGVVSLYIDGSQDDGTIWVENCVKLKPEKEYIATLGFRIYSSSESFNQIAAVVGFTGIIDPEYEGDFKVLGPANQVKGWKTYSLKTTINTDSLGYAWVGCGISVRWETEMIYMLDDVYVEFK